MNLDQHQFFLCSMNNLAKSGVPVAQDNQKFLLGDQNQALKLPSELRSASIFLCSMNNLAKSGAPVAQDNQKILLGDQNQALKLPSV